MSNYQEFYSKKAKLPDDNYYQAQDLKLKSYVLYHKKSGLNKDLTTPNWIQLETKM